MREGILQEGMIDEAGAIWGWVKVTTCLLSLPLTENDMKSKLVSNERGIFYEQRTSIPRTEVYHLDDLTKKMLNFCDLCYNL